MEILDEAVSPNRGLGLSHEMASLASIPVPQRSPLQARLALAHARCAELRGRLLLQSLLLILLILAMLPLV